MRQNRVKNSLRKIEIFMNRIKTEKNAPADYDTIKYKRKNLKKFGEFSSSAKGP